MQAWVSIPNFVQISEISKSERFCFLICGKQRIVCSPTSNNTTIVLYVGKTL